MQGDLTASGPTCVDERNSGTVVRPLYLLCGERIAKSSLADIPEFLMASLMVAIRQASRDFRHWAGALAVNDHLMQRSCARSHWGI